MPRPQTMLQAGSLIFAALLFCNACAAPVTPLRPTPMPTAVAATQQPVASPTTAPIEAPSMALPTASRVATIVATPLPGAAHPAWIAVRQVGDPVEGISTIQLIDADTGQHSDGCPTVGGAAFAWSYDGTWLACVFDYGQSPMITLVNAVDPTQKFEWSLPSSKSQPAPVFLAWSPRAQTLAVSVGTYIYRVTPDPDQQPLVLKHCASYSCAAIAWSPDGLHLATNDRQGLSVLELASGTETSITDEGVYFSGTSDAAHNLAAPIESIAYSPDGTQIGYAAQGGLFVVSVAGGPARRLLPPAARATDLGWSLDGQSIEFIGQLGQREAVSVAGGNPGYGTMIEQTPTLHSDPVRCNVTLRASGAAQIGGLPDPGPPPVGPIYDLFLEFTRSKVVVQLSDSGIYGPILGAAGTKTPTVSLHSIAAWAPGPVRMPRLAVTNPPQRGCAVLELQTMLLARKLDPGAVDGIYGPATAAAVRIFQRNNGLAVDGVVGPETWAGLGGWMWDQ